MTARRACGTAATPARAASGAWRPRSSASRGTRSTHSALRSVYALLACAKLPKVKSKALKSLAIRYLFNYFILKFFCNLGVDKDRECVCTVSI